MIKVTLKRPGQFTENKTKVTLDPSMCASPTLPVFSQDTEEELYLIPAIPTAIETAFKLLMAPNCLDCYVR